jgi:hypothetical protein|tara:strand:- start:5855 stop:6007 length:153 start_codon:yes stop_codon:yes gene_type:complete
MKLEELQILLERASENIRYGNPGDETQWAYNEGIEDLAIELENQINNKNK